MPNPRVSRQGACRPWLVDRATHASLNHSTPNSPLLLHKDQMHKPSPAVVSSTEHSENSSDPRSKLPFGLWHWRVLQFDLTGLANLQVSCRLVCVLNHHPRITNPQTIEKIGTAIRQHAQDGTRRLLAFPT
jgi:hypothetical protein